MLNSAGTCPKARLVQDGDGVELDTRLPDIFMDAEDEDEYGLGIQVNIFRPVVWNIKRFPSFCVNTKKI